MNNLIIDKYEIVNDLLMIKWKGNSESYIPLMKLRDSCPCAECSGESDALGNLYIGERKPKTDLGYTVVRLKTVGYYAIQFFWGDGHGSGIYRFELLKELGDSGK